jgi:LIVCS family branched-chain amino acid:cation transporter
MSQKSIASHLSHVLTTGFAMFSMFFGAGNIVFPLVVGQVIDSHMWYAIGGLLLTAVGVPFIGLLAMVYFNGDYESFFKRIGTVPAYLIILFIMIIIGPVNAIPRCISLSFSTLHMYAPSLSHVMFSALSCIVIFLATYKKSRIVDLLGVVLSPLLLLSLVTIIVKGLLYHPEVAAGQGTTAYNTFMFGLYEGYNTMDLLGTYFFSSVITASLVAALPRREDQGLIAQYALGASIVGAGLLGAVYAGFVFVAHYYREVVQAVAPEVLLGTVAKTVLGDAGGIFVSMAVVLACLTTALTLASIFAEFLHSQVFMKHVCYRSSLILTLLVAFVFSNYQFSEIVAMMKPVLLVLYPTMLVFTIINILHKMTGLRAVKTPVALAAAGAYVWYHAPHLLMYLPFA